MYIWIAVIALALIIGLVLVATCESSRANIAETVVKEQIIFRKDGLSPRLRSELDRAVYALHPYSCIKESRILDKIIRDNKEQKERRGRI